MVWIAVVEPTAYADTFDFDDDNIALTPQESILMLGALCTLAMSILSFWTL